MIKTIVIDCDGCLTDGRKWVDLHGDRTAIAFHARDNEAARRLVHAGYRVVVVTASGFPGIRSYWGRYNVDVFWLRDKARIFEEADLNPAETLGIGDDLLDIPFLEQCSEAYAPADAHYTVRQRFNRLITPGGGGVLEEVEAILSGRVVLNTKENGYDSTY